MLPVRSSRARGLIASADRILVTGAPGSGKTTIARQLAEQSRRNLVDLDEVIGVPLHGGEDRAHRDHLDTLPATDRWICDGTYADSVDGRMRLADVVLLLDLSPLTCARRVISRQRQRRAPVRTIAFLRMLAYTIRFRVGIRGLITRSARDHGVPLVHVRSGREAQQLLVPWPDIPQPEDPAG